MTLPLLHQRLTSELLAPLPHQRLTLTHQRLTLPHQRLTPELLAPHQPLTLPHQRFTTERLAPLPHVLAAAQIDIVTA